MSPRTSKRSSVLELAVLGLLHQSPMHGYELRKRLDDRARRVPRLLLRLALPVPKSLVAQGFIVEDAARPTPTGPAATAKRAKIVYRLTADGKEHLQNLLAEAGPAAWEDENFGVHFAFFGQTDADVRLRILEGRRSRLEERLENVRISVARTRERLDSYTLELQQHGLESRRARGPLAQRADRAPSAASQTSRSAGRPRHGTPSRPGDQSATGTARPHTRQGVIGWVPYALPSSASATAPRRWSRVSSTTRTPTRTARCPG